MSDTDPITNDEDILDSRDIIARIEYLEVALEAYAEDGMDDGDRLDEDERAELAALRDLADQGELNIADWSYGETLVRESYFTDYAKELAEDIGAVGRNAPWPGSHIDWEAAADALLIDYVDLNFGGVTYFAR